jgi:Zn-dependent protease
MSDQLARFARSCVSIIAVLILLPPFYAASEFLDPRRRWGLAFIFVLYLVERWFVVLIHELGHALAAHATGRRIHIIAVWPIAYFVKRRRFDPSPKAGSGDVGGFVLSTSTNADRRRRDEALYALGGVLANFACSAIGFALIIDHLVGRIAEAFIGSFAVLSLVTGIHNLVPIWGPGFLRMDGAFFLDAILGRSNPARERLVQLSAMQIDGAPAASWDRALIEQIERDIPRDRRMQSASPLLYLYYFARRDLARAREILTQISSPYPDAPAWQKIGEAFFAAYLDNDGAAAQEFLDRVPRARRFTYSYWGVAALTRHLLGDHEGTRKAVAKARDFARNEPTPLPQDEEELLNALEAGGEIPDLRPPT